MSWFRPPPPPAKDLEAGAGSVAQSHGQPQLVQPQTAIQGQSKLEPSDRLTPHQLFYLFGVHGFGATILSGGINFAISYGMYSTNDEDAQPIRLWDFPRTLAGDVGVTIIIQSILVWSIEQAVAKRDLAGGAVQPIGFITRPQRTFLRWLFMLDEHRDAAHPGPPRHWPAFALAQAQRIALVALASFLLTWGPAVGVLHALGDFRNGAADPYFARTWLPQAFKAVFGAVLSLLTTPWFSAFWVTRAGWAEVVVDQGGNHERPSTDDGSATEVATMNESEKGVGER